MGSDENVDKSAVGAVEASTMETTEADVDDVSKPPDGGYGWVCVACCFTINCFTWGVISVYGVYLSHYLTTSTFPFATPLNYSLIGGLIFGVSMLSATFVTHIVRYTGIRPPMLFGSFLLGASFVAASFATRIWHLYLTQGVLLGIASGFTWIPSPGVLSQWFEKRRSMANGISASGAGVGGLIFSFGTGSMISNLGLGWSLRITGVVALVMTTIAAIFLRDRNAVIRPTQRPFDRELIRRPDVLLLLSWGFLTMLGYMSLLYSLSDFAVSIGLNHTQSTQVTAFLNMGTALGRPLIGIASDRFGRFEVAAGMTLACGILCFAIWIPAEGFVVAVVFAIISGAILGVFWMTVAPLCVEIAGLKHLQSLLSLVYFSIVLPTTFAETIALYLRQPGHARPYLYTQIYCGICYVLAAICLWGVRIISSKRRSRA